MGNLTRFVDLAINKSTIIRFLKSFEYTIEEKETILNGILTVIEYLKNNRKHIKNAKNKAPFSVFKNVCKDIKITKKLFDQLYSAYISIAAISENNGVPKALIKIKNYLTNFNLEFATNLQILSEFTHKYYDSRTIYAKYQKYFLNIDEDDVIDILDDMRIEFANIKKDITSKVLDVLCLMEPNYNIIHDKILYYDVFDYSLIEKKKYLIVAPHVNFISKLIVEAISTFEITIITNDVFLLSILEKRTCSIPNFHCISMERFLNTNVTVGEFDCVIVFGENVNELKDEVLDKAMTSLTVHGKMNYLDLDTNISRKMKEIVKFNSSIKLANITLLPFGRDFQISNRQQILTIVNNSDIHDFSVKKYTKSVNEVDKNIITLEKYVLTMPNSSFNYACSIRNLYADCKIKFEKHTDRLANQARVIELLNEISVYYTISKSRSDDHYRVNAYARSDFNNGEKLTGSEKSFQTKDPNKIHDWIVRTYPFSTVEKNGVTYDIRETFSREILHNYNTDDMSIKTLYYVLQEFDEKISDEDVNTFREYVFFTELGDLFPTQFIENADGILNRYFEDTNVCIKVRVLIMRLLQLAVKQGLIKAENSIFLNANASYLAERYLKENLRKRCFSEQEFRTIFYDCLAKYSSNKTEYLSILMMLLIPMNSYEIAALKYKDVTKVKIGNFEFDTLHVTRRINVDGKEYLSFGRREKYRFIPIPKVIRTLIQNQKDSLLAKGYSEVEVNDMPIVRNSNSDSENMFKVVPPVNITKLFKRCIKELSIPNLIVNIPKDGDTKDIDLNDNRNILRTNLIYYFTHVGLMVDELEYLLGHQGADVLAQNYIDYENDFSQLEILVKMERVYYALLSELEQENREYDVQNVTVLKSKRNCINNIHVSFEINEDTLVKVKSNLGSDIKAWVVKKC